MEFTALRKFWWVILIIVIIFTIFGIAAYNGHQHEGPGQEQTYKNQFGWPNADAKYITVVPVDLTQIQSISKYRSCAGHDRSGYSFNRVLETDRSMKHYLYPNPEFQGTLDKVEMFAPFNGTVFAIQLESEETFGTASRTHNGNSISFATPVDPNVIFTFWHIYFAQDFKVGDNVSAGQLIGYASLGDKGDDFDIDLTSKYRYQNDSQKDIEVLGSAFDHMTDSVLAEFARYGVTPENMKFSKEYRDANLCGYNGTYHNNSPLNQGRENDNWVQLKH